MSWRNFTLLGRTQGLLAPAVLAALWIALSMTVPARADWLDDPGGIDDNDAAAAICTPACAKSGGWSGWWKSTSDTGSCECGQHQDEGAAAAPEQPAADQGNAPDQTEEQPANQSVAPAAAEAEPLPQSGTTAADREDILSSSNGYRARYCVSNLGWSKSLEESAQRWADHLAESCDFSLTHSGAGENLYVAGRTATEKVPGSEAVDDWYGEVKHYDFAAGQSRDGETTGHFTQLVWAGTTDVGCGVAVCRDAKGFTETTWVCQYAPAGNITGDYIQNVPQQCR
jgi:uncharacterized protein YkwD